MFKDLLKSEKQKALYDYWNSKRTQNQLPGREDIRPEEMVPLLPCIGLIDVLDNHSYQYRLIGTQMVKFFKKDFTGSLVDVVKPGNYGEFLINLYGSVCELKRPVYSKSAFLYSNRGDILTQRLMLPLVDHTGDVNMLLFSTIPEWNYDLSATDVQVIDDSVGYKEHDRFMDLEGKSISISTVTFDKL